jgi:hypothetical protein
MKVRIRVPYGVASVTRIGSLRDPTAGQAMTPTFVLHDAKITQDDGTGTDDLDTLPSVDGTDVLIPVSAAEATALATPGTNGYNRVIQLYDQGTKAWIDLDIVVETEGNSHLATFPNGVVYGFTPAAAMAAGTLTLPSAAQTGVNPLRKIAVVVGSDEPLDLGATAFIDGWTAGTQVATMSGNWSRTPTGTLSSIRVALFAAEQLTSTAAQAAAAAALTAHTGDVTLTVVANGGNSATTFVVNTDAGTTKRLGMLRLTSGTLAGEDRPVIWTGTQVTVLAPTSVPAGLTDAAAYSATPAAAVTGIFRPA